MIRISDNGSGIDAEDLPRVFNRFDRVVEAACGAKRRSGSACR